MTDKSLIISPTGCSMFHDSEYEPKEDHWRYTNSSRLYETVVVTFNDFIPEQNSYDRWEQYPIRHKWKQIPELLDKLDIKWYNFPYIGIWDDDYCTNWQSINRSLELAYQFDFPFFQQSLKSWTVYPCLENDPSCTFSKTNFTEMGICWYRTDVFSKALKLLRDYQYNESEWGIDKIMYDYLKLPAYIVHEVSAKHMRKESWYDKTNAFREMDYLMKEWFPKYHKEKFGTDYQYNDNQVIIEKYKLR